jgi:hypothetical protein
MLQGPPPRLDHRVRELELREGQNATEDARGEQFVDLSVHVLHTRVCQHDRGIRWARCASTRPRAARPHCSPERRCPPPTRPAPVGRSCRLRRAGRRGSRSSSRMTVVSMCQSSSGRVVRTPSFGFVGCARSRGRNQPYLRTRRYQVDRDAHTVPSSCASTASVPVGTRRYSSEALLLTPEDVARRYGLRLSTVQEWRRRGLLHASGH